MKLSLIILSFVLAAAFAVEKRERNNKPFHLVCYFGSWAHWRPGDGKMDPEDIDPHLCTHVVYGFTSLDRFEYVLKSYDPWLDEDLGNYQKFINLRQQNPHLTTLVAVGGWGDGSLRYSRMSADPALRKKFIDSVLAFLQKYDFDGLDLDWEYPGMMEIREGADWHDLEGQDRVPSGNSADKPNHLQLLKELYEAFEPYGYLLTAAVSAGKRTIDEGYEVHEITKYLHILNLMTYDLHGAWEQRTHHNSPLYINPAESEADQQLTAEFAVDYWTRQRGADPKKIVMGMPLYGRSFEIAGEDQGFNTPTVQGSKGGQPGPYTQQAGVLGYNEYCREKAQWTSKWSEAAGVPYAVKGNNWLGFDSPESLKHKVDFIRKKGLGGGMVWSIETDDFRGSCGQRYPLLTAINNALFNEPGPDPTPGPTSGPDPEPTPEPTQPPTQPPTEPPTQPDVTTSESNSFECKEEGYFADPNDNTIYHQCVSDGRGGYNDYVFNCPQGTEFDDSIDNCVHKRRH